MKTILFLIVVLFSSYPIIAQDTGENILINGDFESSKNGIMPDGWNGDNHYYSLDKEAVSGKFSLKYSNNNPSNYPICSQTVDLKPGDTYSAGAMIKTSNITGNDFGASICIEWFDKDGKWLGGIYPQGIKGTNNWTEISTIFTVPNDAAKEQFSCYVRKGMRGTAWFDNAYLKQYKPDKMNVILLSPVYRGLIFEDGDSEINLLVDLEAFKDNLSQSEIVTELFGLSGKKLDTKITDIIKNNFKYKINIDTKDLPIGSYFVKVNLIGNNNKLLNSWETSVKKISSKSKPAVYIDNNKRLIVDGKAIFPLGMYWGEINEPDLKIYAASKFNFILPYIRPTDEQMKLAEKYNIKVFYSVKDYYQGTQFAPPKIQSLADEDILFKQTVQHFKDAKLLLGWYNNDELPLEYIDRLDRHYNQITEFDPNHPVLSIFVNPDQAAFYINSSDIIGSDPYVVPKAPLYKVGEATKIINQKIDNSRPVWMVIQAHNLGNYKELISDPQNYRSPTFDEMRNLAWQAICEGASGLIFYSYFDLKQNADVPFDTQWSNLKKIAEEIYNVSDVLLSTEKTDTVKIEGANNDNSWFNWIAKNYNKHLYIFIVDNGKAAGKIKITIPRKYTNVHMLNAPAEKLSITNSEFSDSIGNLELKVYVAE